MFDEKEYKQLTSLEAQSSTTVYDSETGKVYNLNVVKDSHGNILYIGKTEKLFGIF